jgi:hypothetical protein
MSTKIPKRNIFSTPHNNYYWIQHPGPATTELFHKNIAFLFIQNAKGNIDAKMKQLLTGLDDGLSSQL